MKRILVSGYRNPPNPEIIRSTLERYHQMYGPCILIHGDCRGTDHVARDAAYRLGWFTWSFPADWTHLGRAAGPVRNQRMLEDTRPQLALVFLHAKSRGTRDMLRRLNAWQLTHVTLESVEVVGL